MRLARRATALVALLLALVFTPSARGSGPGTPILPVAEPDLTFFNQVALPKVRRLERRLTAANRTIARLQKALNRKRFEAMCRRPATIVELGRCLQSDGFRVSQNPAFGGVDPVHAPGSYHYPPCSCAIDVNWMGFNEYGQLSSLYARLRRTPGVIELLWQVPGHFDHLHVALR